MPVRQTKWRRWCEIDGWSSMDWAAWRRFIIVTVVTKLLCWLVEKVEQQWFRSREMEMLTDCRTDFHTVVTYLSGNHLSRWKLGRFESLRSSLLPVSRGDFRHVFTLRAMRQLLVWIDALLEMKLNVTSANICMSNCLSCCVWIRKKVILWFFKLVFPPLNSSKWVLLS